jgi:hypothetical protein
MATEVRWYNDEHTIVLLRYHTAEDENPTIEERVAGLMEMVHQATTVEQPVAALIDLRFARVLPKGRWLAALKAVIKNAPDNIDLVTIVGSRAPSFFFGLINILMRTSGTPFDVLFFRTLEESEAELAEWQAGRFELAS